MPRHPKSKQARDLATLKALEGKHQELVNRINSLLPMLLVVLPPFVIYSLFNADPNSKLYQDTEFSKLPSSVISAFHEANATIARTCQDGTDLFEQTGEFLELVLKTARQTFKEHKIRCTTEIPYRILCEGPLDELRAYDEFLNAHPKIAAHPTHASTCKSLLVDVRSAI